MNIVILENKARILVLVDFFMSKPDGRYLITKDPMKVNDKSPECTDKHLFFFSVLAKSSSKRENGGRERMMA